MSGHRVYRRRTEPFFSDHKCEKAKTRRDKFVARTEIIGKQEADLRNISWLFYKTDKELFKRLNRIADFYSKRYVNRCVWFV